MPDQAAVLASASPPALSGGTGPALDTDAGGRVIPLYSRRRRPSPEAVEASRACHPAQRWADERRTAIPS
ncbi:MAG: hypothetical protein QOG43_988 [Actinomycetota bacterium]|jgi:hypothetical protein|nr:hypothetical protein [Actinomycetota bacterium]